VEKITKRTVDALKPSKVGVQGSEQFLWDSELRGFGVRVSPAGLKSFIVQYRTPKGRHRRTVIGRHGMMTAEQARQAAWDVLSAVAKGIDPAAPPEPDRNAITVSALRDWYLAEAEAGHILGRRRRPIKASTLAMDRSRIEAHQAATRRAQVGALTLGDIEGAQADIAAGKTQNRAWATVAAPPPVGRASPPARSQHSMPSSNTRRHDAARAPSGRSVLDAT
jgi:hypothetical protein